MKQSRRSLLLLSLPALLTVLSSNGYASEPHIHDHAYVFKNNGTKERAEEEINRFLLYPPHKNLRIETIDTVEDLPLAWQKDFQHRVKEFDLEIEEEKMKLFEELAEYRIKAVDLKGVYILVCRKPEHVQVSVSEDTKPYFTQKDINDAQALLVNALKWKDAPSTQSRARKFFTKFRKANPLRGLREVIGLVRRRLVHNLPADGTSWAWGLGTIIGSIGLWMFLGIVRSRLRKWQDPEQVSSFNPENEADLPFSPLGGATGTIAGDALASRLFGKRTEVPVANPPLDREEIAEDEMPVPS